MISENEEAFSSWLFCIRSRIHDALCFHSVNNSHPNKWKLNISKSQNAQKSEMKNRLNLWDRIKIASSFDNISSNLMPAYMQTLPFKLVRGKISKKSSPSTARSTEDLCSNSKFRVEDTANLVWCIVINFWFTVPYLILSLPRYPSLRFIKQMFLRW